MNEMLKNFVSGNTFVTEEGIEKTCIDNYIWKMQFLLFSSEPLTYNKFLVLLESGLISEEDIINMVAEGKARKLHVNIESEDFVKELKKFLVSYMQKNGIFLNISKIPVDDFYKFSSVSIEDIKSILIKDFRKMKVSELYREYKSLF